MQHLRGMVVREGAGYWLGGRGVVPKLWLLPMEPLRRMIAPTGMGPLPRGTRQPAQSVVGTYAAPTGDGSPQRRGPAN